jgi:tRNA-Thr(GGU) m(6)t(6)A37 methyltransferase TsaA
MRSDEELNMVEVNYTPIGIIHSCHEDAVGTPIQPTAAEGLPGQVELDPQYKPGLKDLDGFSHIILLYHFDRVDKVNLEVKPFLDECTRGVFATRAPVRPNPIGLSIVRLVAIQDNWLDIEDIDVLDGTPLLDIKPYVDKFDARVSERQGWLQNKSDLLQGKQDDGRFIED